MSLNDWPKELILLLLGGLLVLSGVLVWRLNGLEAGEVEFLTQEAIQTDQSDSKNIYQYPNITGNLYTRVLGVFKVSVNQASQAELESLPGIGPVYASQIIAGRPYSRIEELIDRRIISAKLFSRIKEQLEP